MSSYTGEKIATKGKVILNCKVGSVVKALEFQVFDGSAAPIIGLTSACELKLVKRTRQEKNVEISMINEESKDKYLEKYKNVFEGIGKIKEYEYKIELKEGSIGKIEPCRHVPFKLID